MVVGQYSIQNANDDNELFEMFKKYRRSAISTIMVHSESQIAKPIFQN